MSQDSEKPPAYDDVVRRPPPPPLQTHTCLIHVGVLARSLCDGTCACRRNSSTNPPSYSPAAIHGRYCEERRTRIDVFNRNLIRSSSPPPFSSAISPSHRRLPWQSRQRHSGVVLLISCLPMKKRGDMAALNVRENNPVAYSHFLSLPSDGRTGRREPHRPTITCKYGSLEIPTAPIRDFGTCVMATTYSSPRSVGW